MNIPTPSPETVQTEVFQEVLNGQFTVTAIGRTTAMCIVTDLLEGIETGGIGITFRSINSRYPSADVSGELSSTGGSLVHLGLERATYPMEKYWDLSYLKFISGKPGLGFEIDFFNTADNRSLDLQGEQIDLNDERLDYARRQTSEGLSSYFRLLGARRKLGVQ
jgi:hypothetical protein